MIRRGSALRSKFNRSPLAKRIARGAVWSVFGAIVSSGIMLLSMMLVARLLGKEGYGRFVAIQSTLGMFGVFAGMGIGVAASRYSAEFRFRDVRRLARILALSQRAVVVFGLAASLGLALGSSWLADRILNAPELSVPISFAALTVFFSAVDSYQKSVLLGLEAMRALALGAIAGVLLSVPVMLLGAIWFGLQGVAASLTVSAMVQFVISRYQMRREMGALGIDRSPDSSWSEWPILWTFALPALLAGALVSPTHWAVQSMLVHVPNGYAQLAVLGVSMQWFSMIMFLPGAAARVVGPILTEFVTGNDHTKTRQVLVYAMVANALVAIPAAVIVAILSPTIMILYGEKFRGEHLPLALAAITASGVAVMSPIGNLIVAKARMWLGALMNAGWAAVYVGVAYLLAPRGATGIMLALFAGYLAHAIWTLMFAARHHKIPQTS